VDQLQYADDVVRALIKLTAAASAAGFLFKARQDLDSLAAVLEAQTKLSTSINQFMSRKAKKEVS
jgi:hypothetical protein